MAEDRLRDEITRRCVSSSGTAVDGTTERVGRKLRRESQAVVAAVALTSSPRMDGRLTRRKSTAVIAAFELKLSSRRLADSDADADPPLLLIDVDERTEGVFRGAGEAVRGAAAGGETASSVVGASTVDDAAANCSAIRARSDASTVHCESVSSENADGAAVELLV